MDRKFIDEVVDAHNVYRSRHQVSPLSHSRELSQTAQKWAEQLAATNSFQHSSSSYRGESLGENIAMKWSSRPDSYTGKCSQEVTDQWYSEIKMIFIYLRFFSFSGHFTQVVWKGSREIGVGKATTKDGKIIVVANYLPAGNMLGDYSRNVLPPRDGQTSVPQTQQRGTLRYLKMDNNMVTKIIEEETITKPNGETVTNRKESVKKDDSTGSGSNWILNPIYLNQTIKSGSSSSDSSSETSKRPKTMSEFTDSSLKQHNKVRAKHGVAPLKLSKDLCAHAQKWAEHLASSDSFQHSQCTLGGERVGENIACKWSSGGGDYSSQEVLDQWYSEISKHDYNSERSLGTGKSNCHFTQVVWKGSKELGIGKAKAAGGKIIVVANYRPAGNMIGQFRQNVFPPQ
ncbi:hypothetical protein LOTGIDRAFT_130175 [Lottia gigantea]|uniref:SCP domain-containing protein n=1 Tax=Lottia gigantea TaxID=225164 RepID=V3ZNJ9_LOTGI|nr:hypothetical protein LOTGIDRAFT_130175 [Lottia gigantea]ESO85877.1 hypothetical protein LOTGIDRAFT_130175 [Lottia gigantea]